MLKLLRKINNGFADKHKEFMEGEQEGDFYFYEDWTWHDLFSWKGLPLNAQSWSNDGLHSCMFTDRNFDLKSKFGANWRLRILKHHIWQISQRLFFGILFFHSGQFWVLMNKGHRILLPLLLLCNNIWRWVVLNRKIKKIFKNCSPWLIWPSWKDPVLLVPIPMFPANEYYRFNYLLC